MSGSGGCKIKSIILILSLFMRVFAYSEDLPPAYQNAQSIMAKKKIDGKRKPKPIYQLSLKNLLMIELQLPKGLKLDLPLIAYPTIERKENHAPGLAEAMANLPYQPPPPMPSWGPALLAKAFGEK
jgi:hypothetical protein